MKTTDYTSEAAAVIFFAVDLTTHEIVWTFKSNDIIHCTAAVDDNRVYFSSFDGNVYALNKADGSLVWKFKSVGQRYFPKGEMSGSPVLQDGILFVTGRDYNFYAIDVLTGTALCNKHFDKGWATSASVKDSMVLAGTSDDRMLIAYDIYSGKEHWKCDVKFNIFGKCNFSANQILVCTIWGKLFSIDQSTGKVNWTFTTEGFLKNSSKYYKADDTFKEDIGSILRKPADWIKAEYEMGGMYSTPAIVNGMVIITTTDGIIYALKI